MARDGERGRGDWKARRGSRDSGPYAGGAGDAGPVDIAAVRRDDALIDAIVSGGPVQTDSAEEFQLAALLADWRAELVEPPIPSTPDLDAVVAAVNQEIGARKVRVGAQTRGKLRLLYPITGAAAALALIIGGTTAFSYSAEPGDPLWRVKEVVFSEQAQSTVVQRADSDLSQAGQALAQGDYNQVAALLERAQTNVDQVSDGGKKQDLETAWQQLLDRLRDVRPELATQLEEAVQPSTKPRPGNTTTVDPTTGNTVTMLPPNNGATNQPANPTQAGVPSETADETTEPAKPSTSPTTEPQTTQIPGIPGLPGLPGTELPSTTAPSNGGGLPSGIIPTLPSGGIQLPTEIPTDLLPPGVLSPSPTN